MGYLRKDNKREPLSVRERRRDDDDFDDYDEEEERFQSELKETLSEEELDSNFAWAMRILEDNDIKNGDELDAYVETLSKQERALLLIGIEDEERFGKEMEREFAEMRAMLDNLYRIHDHIKQVGENWEKYFSSPDWLRIVAPDELTEPEPLDEAFIDNI